MIFTVVFYGLKTFRCKTAQFYAMRRESRFTESSSICDGVQLSENTRKNSFLNYKSAALPAVLLAQLPSRTLTMARRADF
jgi:hypothetical protein